MSTESSSWNGQYHVMREEYVIFTNRIVLNELALDFKLSKASNPIRATFDTRKGILSNTEVNSNFYNIIYVVKKLIVFFMT